MEGDGYAVAVAEVKKPVPGLDLMRTGTSKI